MNAIVHTQHTRNHLIGIMLATGAALSFSVKAIIVKLAYQYDVGALNKPWIHGP
jgi:hypothetical protein